MSGKGSLCNHALMLIKNLIFKHVQKVHLLTVSVNKMLFLQLLALHLLRSSLVQFRGDFFLSTASVISHMESFGRLMSLHWLYV